MDVEIRFAIRLRVRVLSLGGHIAATSEQARDRDILVEFFPMQAGTAQFDLFALGGRRTQQAGKPSERTPSVRPSVKSTHIVCSSKRTAAAEIFIPGSQQAFPVLIHHLNNTRKVARMKPS